MALKQIFFATLSCSFLFQQGHSSVLKIEKEVREFNFPYKMSSSTADLMSLSRSTHVSDPEDDFGSPKSVCQYKRIEGEPIKTVNTNILKEILDDSLITDFDDYFLRPLPEYRGYPPGPSGNELKNPLIKKKPKPKTDTKFEVPKSSLPKPELPVTLTSALPAQINQQDELNQWERGGGVMGEDPEYYFI